MPLPSPNLDDRDFEQLVRDAHRYIETNCPGWTDLSPGDPGTVLLEAFAHITETMIYRLNRVPEKAYIEFLRLMGVSLVPPSAASAALTFSVTRPAAGEIEIPRGTRVTSSRAGGGENPIIFTTTEHAVIPAGALEASGVLAHHCDLVQGELAGRGTGQPGLVLKAARPPIIASTGDDLDLVVGVEALAAELGGRVPAIEFRGKVYRIWQRVEHFSETGRDRKVYIADRLSGEIRFGNSARGLNPDGSLQDPRALGDAPPDGREIRLWYRRGGGPAGNVAAGTLKEMKDPIPGVQVINPAPAAGGRAGETLANALVRGPLEMRAPWRAITASDFKNLALSVNSVARAEAFTRAALWKFARPGTVEVILVPAIPESELAGGRVTLPQLLDRQTAEALQSVSDLLNERQPLGTNSVAVWAKYKTVRVQARVVAHDEEDPDTIRNRVLERLHSFINPLPSTTQPDGWPFGEALRVSNIYDAGLRQPGVRYVDQVQLILDDVPESDVSVLVADPFQGNTWHCGTGTHLFRSGNDGDGWEMTRVLDRGIPYAMAAHPGIPGLLALAAKLPGDAGTVISVSSDCGESWTFEREIGSTVETLAWTSRDRIPVLLMATNQGLYELAIQPDASSAQVRVFDGDEKFGFYSVAVAVDARASVTHVAVAAQAKGGIYLSSEGGRAGTFRPIGLKGADIRVLAVQRQGMRTFLWTGAAATPPDEGSGCQSWELLASGDPPEGWLPFAKQWTGGNCTALAFQGSSVLAGSHHAGVLRLPARRADAAWERPSIDCGLPLREARRLFYPMENVALDPACRKILCATAKGVYRSLATDQAPVFENCSARIFSERVTLPPNWLFCSGEHSITVVNEHAR